MHDKGSMNTKFGEGSGNQVNQIRRKDAEDLCVCPGGIRQRSQEIEYSARADLFARGDRVARGGVGSGRKEKADAEFADGAPGLLQRQVDANAQRFQNVGGAAARADGTIAVLGDMRTSGGGNESRSGGDVERAGTVAARAASIEHVRWAIGLRGKNRGSVTAHDAGKRAEFGRSNMAPVQSHEQAHDVRSGDAAGKEFLHESFGFRPGKPFEPLGFLNQWERRIHAVTGRMVA